MPVQGKLRGYVGNVQHTGAAVAPVQGKLRGLSAVVTSGPTPVVGAVRGRLRELTATVVIGAPVTPNPVKGRLRGLNVKVLSGGTPTPGSVRTGAWAKNGGQVVPVRVYCASELRALGMIQ